MNDPQRLGRELSDEEIGQLHDLLEAHAVPHDGMSLEMLDGFLSALVVGPDLVMPSEYQPLIWNHAVEWASAEQAEQAQRLILKLWNDIVRRVHSEPPDDDDDSEEATQRIEAAMPLLAFPESLDEDADEDDPTADPLEGLDPDFPFAAAWALGFMRGVDLRSESWMRWESDDEQIADDLQLIVDLTVFDADQAESLGMEVDHLLTLQERMELAAGLPVVLYNFNVYRSEQDRPAPARRGDIPGRNDPCPCGSGLKFKKCCGDPAKLN